MQPVWIHYSGYWSTLLFRHENGAPGQEGFGFQSGFNTLIRVFLWVLRAELNVGQRLLVLTQFRVQRPFIVEEPKACVLEPQCLPSSHP